MSDCYPPARLIGCTGAPGGRGNIASVYRERVRSLLPEGDSKRVLVRAIRSLGLLLAAPTRR